MSQRLHSHCKETLISFVTMNDYQGKLKKHPQFVSEDRKLILKIFGKGSSLKDTLGEFQIRHALPRIT